MPFRFRESINLLPGVRLNLNKRSESVTLGSGRVHETVSSTGRRRTSVRLFPGLSWFRNSGGSRRRRG
jgi:hypothetical protein